MEENKSLISFLMDKKWIKLLKEKEELPINMGEIIHKQKRN
jgi:hypothetical protein